MIGLSLSACVRDIVLGRVDENLVEKIYTACKVPTPNGWHLIFERYYDTHWVGMGLWGKIVTEDMLIDGRLIQPRLWTPPKIAWSYNRNWVNNEGEIEWLPG